MATDSSISDGELLDEAVDLFHRLGRQLDALENKERGAVKDVAAQLRTILVTGQGDDVLRRVQQRTKVPWPQVHAARALPNRKGLIFGVGAMPTNAERTPSSSRNGDRWVSVDEWTRMTALVVADCPTRRVNSWERVISAYANTYGSHVGKTIPDLLQHMGQVSSCGLGLGEYMVHCAGIVAESALSQLLDAAGGASVVVPQHRLLSPLVAVTLDEGFPENAFDASFAPPPDDTVPGTTELLRLHVRSEYFRFNLISYGGDEFELDGKSSGPVDESPDWW